MAVPLRWRHAQRPTSGPVRQRWRRRWLGPGVRHVSPARRAEASTRGHPRASPPPPAALPHRAFSSAHPPPAPPPTPEQPQPQPQLGAAAALAPPPPPLLLLVHPRHRGADDLAEALRLAESLTGATCPALQVGGSRLRARTAPTPPRLPPSGYRARMPPTQPTGSRSTFFGSGTLKGLAGQLEWLEAEAGAGAKRRVEAEEVEAGAGAWVGAGAREEMSSGREVRSGAGGFGGFGGDSSPGGGGGGSASGGGGGRTPAFINAVLTPLQERNIEAALGRPVLDRVGLIIRLFAQRAHTREARLQVELASLTYQLPRLVRVRGADGRRGAYGVGAGAGSGVGLGSAGGGGGGPAPQVVSARQRGASGAGGLGGGGGSGDPELQQQRFRIRGRIAALRRELSSLAAQRGVQRQGRRAAGMPTVAVVGYTNVGKTSLAAALCSRGARLPAPADMLFATLDPAVRRAWLPGRGAAVAVSDTVGFIRDLPLGLVAAFRATLEEVVAADLLLHVLDASSPAAGQQRAAVLGVLRQLGVGEEALSCRTVEVWNKVDLLGGAAGVEVEEGRQGQEQERQHQEQRERLRQAHQMQPPQQQGQHQETQQEPVGQWAGQAGEGARGGGRYGASSGVGGGGRLLGQAVSGNVDGLGEGEDGGGEDVWEGEEVGEGEWEEEEEEEVEEGGWEEEQVEEAEEDEVEEDADVGPLRGEECVRRWREEDGDARAGWDADGARWSGTGGGGGSGGGLSAAEAKQAGGPAARIRLQRRLFGDPALPLTTDAGGAAAGAAAPTPVVAVPPADSRGRRRWHSGVGSTGGGAAEAQVAGCARLAAAAEVVRAAHAAGGAAPAAVVLAAVAEGEGVDEVRAALEAVMWGPTGLEAAEEAAAGSAARRAYDGGATGRDARPGGGGAPTADGRWVTPALWLAARFPWPPPPPPAGQWAQPAAPPARRQSYPNAGADVGGAAPGAPACAAAAAPPLGSSQPPAPTPEGTRGRYWHVGPGAQGAAAAAPVAGGGTPAGGSPAAGVAGGGEEEDLEELIRFLRRRKRRQPEEDVR
ncbi:hypothetical protein TSOC_001858 [Tetrabaena socialis]|uniref:Hflx-type G domain-containing protein n=1 Tax=Tetrabaena socialis TaxID=47790 RepID=A0A2J8AFP3_9CHLO|nr:hypothetical protein TSOC_001858 [Tetrabaena socialis]|eukprot:PNH11338.1 hypothetical protein TSOC_001858 [Tetrabaena socialis]